MHLGMTLLELFDVDSYSLLQNPDLLIVGATLSLGSCIHLTLLVLVTMGQHCYEKWTEILHLVLPSTAFVGTSL